ncbi:MULTISPECIES: FecR family protein [unclassified Carboxylicivirga]|uniref:FecR family protein n=1 Tax=Carboxylicivirga TaxID=1628153 RepID=UPI003D333987
MKDITPFEIADSIAKLLKHEALGDGERQRLEAWLKADAGNAALYEQLKKEGNLSEYLLQREQIDVQAALSNVYHRNKSPQLLLKPMMGRWLAYAAAIILPGIVLWTLFSDPKPYDGDQAETLVQNITPGSKKAVLYLADGQQVELDQAGNQTLKEEDGTLIKTTEQSITYNHGSEASNKAAAGLTNTIYIPRKGEFSLTLADGTKVWLNAESSLEYPTYFSSATREVTLDGEAYFEVSKDTTRPFIVKTKGAAVTVLGTAFNVAAYNTEKTVTTTLVRGSVSFASEKAEDSESVILKPGMQGVINAEQKGIEVKTVDPAVYVAWKNGEFRFERMTLEEIFRTLQRWYDVDVVYHNELAKSKRFTGDLERYEEINTHLNMISLTTNVQFEIKNNVVYVK